MGCLKTDHCCCCFSLRTGGLILGWLGVICSAFGILLNLSRSDAYYEALRKRSELLNVSYTPETDLIQNIITILLSGLLLCGIYNKRSSFLLPQVVFSLFGFILILIYIGVLLIGFIIVASSRNHDAKNASDVLFGVLIVLLPVVGIVWHLTAVLCSLYRKIKEENENCPSVVYYVETQHDPYKV